MHRLVLLFAAEVVLGVLTTVIEFTTSALGRTLPTVLISVPTSRILVLVPP